LVPTPVTANTPLMPSPGGGPPSMTTTATVPVVLSTDDDFDLALLSRDMHE